MARRIDNLLWCLAGCAIASLLGLWLMLTLNAAILALFCWCLFPPIACWLAGIRDQHQLVRIAVYAALGWALTSAFEPAIAESATSRLRRIVERPLVGYDWHIPASIVSTLLALVGTWFVPNETKAGAAL